MSFGALNTANMQRWSVWEFTSSAAATDYVNSWLVIDSRGLCNRLVDLIIVIDNIN